MHSKQLGRHLGGPMKQIIQPEHSTQLSFKHYPILCAFFKEYELSQLFDLLLPKKRYHEVSHAQCLLLFVCDCLTARTPLYRYTDMLANLDVEMILVQVSSRAFQ